MLFIAFLRQNNAALKGKFIDITKQNDHKNDHKWFALFDPRKPWGHQRCGGFVCSYHHIRSFVPTPCHTPKHERSDVTPYRKNLSIGKSVQTTSRMVFFCVLLAARTDGNAIALQVLTWNSSMSPRWSHVNVPNPSCNDIPFSPHHDNKHRNRNLKLIFPLKPVFCQTHRKTWFGVHFLDCYLELTN